VLPVSLFSPAVVEMLHGDNTTGMSTFGQLVESIMKFYGFNNLAGYHNIFLEMLCTQLIIQDMLLIIQDMLLIILVICVYK
jgi:uncharacterized membrane protein affecting hemolysin expression